MEYIITEKIIEEYKEHLVEEEKSTATIKKYISDIRKLVVYAGGQEITKKLMVGYKEDLRVNKGYKLSSINSFIIAANRLFEYLEWYGLRVKTYHIQKEAYVSEKKDLSMQEYRRLVDTARHKGKKRLAMIIQTLCATGIRISELIFLTVESVKCGEIEIYCKKKHRKALIPEKLQALLFEYIKENNIESGVCYSKFFLKNR